MSAALEQRPAPVAVSPSLDAEVRYIKLGQNGDWEAECIREGVLRLGFHGNHAKSLARDWAAVRQAWLGAGGAGAATRAASQIRDFYEQPTSTVWLTFHQRRMWWCMAQAGPPEEMPDLRRQRRTVAGWSDKDVRGDPLRISTLDGRVSALQAYRGTICRVHQADYVLRRIRAEPSPEVLRARADVAALRGSVAELISGLWWSDFELLTELIFTRAGWQRVSATGGTEKDIDLDLVAPVTGRRAFAQVKSRSHIAELQHYMGFLRDSDYDEMFYVVHTEAEALKAYADGQAGVTVVGRDELAELVIESGLVGWLIAKRS